MERHSDSIYFKLGFSVTIEWLLKIEDSLSESNLLVASAFEDVIVNWFKNRN